jgi:hypothetical protein
MSGELDTLFPRFCLKIADQRADFAFKLVNLRGILLFYSSPCWEEGVWFSLLAYEQNTSIQSSNAFTAASCRAVEHITRNT